DVVDVLGRVGECPVLSGWNFQPVAQVGAAEEPPRGLMRGGVMAGDAFHFAETLRPDRARVHADRHRISRSDLERGEERLVVPGPRIMCSVHGLYIASLPDDGSPAILPI